MITEQLKKTYFNILIKPETLAKWVLGEGKKWLRSKCWGWAEELRNRYSVLVEACPKVNLGLRELKQLCSQRINYVGQIGHAGSCCSEATCSQQQVLREGRMSPQQCSWGPPSCLQDDPESEKGCLTLNSSWQPVGLFSFLHCRDVRLLILEHGRWSMIDKYQTLMNGLSIESLSSFVKAFKSQLFVEGLVQGNFTSRVSTASAADVHWNLFLKCALTQLPQLQHSPASWLPLLSWQSGGSLVQGSFASNDSGMLISISHWGPHSCQFEQGFFSFFPEIWI